MWVASLCLCSRQWFGDLRNCSHCEMVCKKAGDKPCQPASIERIISRWITFCAPMSSVDVSQRSDRSRPFLDVAANHYLAVGGDVA